MELKNSSSVFTRWQFFVYTPPVTTFRRIRTGGGGWLFAPIRECLTSNSNNQNSSDDIWPFADYQFVTVPKSTTSLSVDDKCLPLSHIFQVQKKWLVPGCSERPKVLTLKVDVYAELTLFLICSSSGNAVQSSSTSCTASLLEAGLCVCICM